MRNSLLRNNGDGTFTDVTRAAGLSSPVHSTHSAAWADYDNDGWVDVFVGHELTPEPALSQPRRRHLRGRERRRRRRRDGIHQGRHRRRLRQRRLSRPLRLEHVRRQRALSQQPRRHLHRTWPPRSAYSKPFASFPTWFFDDDNDGWLDIFVASYPNSVEEFVKHYLGLPPSADTLTLYRNNGNGTFTNVSAKMGLARVVPAMGANFGDLDNDGFLDMYLGTGAPSFAALMPNVMLKNDGGRRFVDVTEASGTGHLQKGHGVAFVDLDNDGDQDVVLNVGGAVPGDRYEDALFENPGTGGASRHRHSRWSAIKSNRAAIGAKHPADGPGRARRSELRVREVTSGGSFGSNSLTQHIGLGPAAIDRAARDLLAGLGYDPDVRDVSRPTAPSR